MKVFIIKLDNENLEHAPSRYIFAQAGRICKDIGWDINCLAGVELPSGKQIRAWGHVGPLEGLPILIGG